MQSVAGAGGQLVIDIHLVDFGLNEHLARRNIQIVQQRENGLVFLRRCLQQDGIVERVRNDSRNVPNEFAASRGVAEIRAGNVGSSGPLIVRHGASAAGVEWGSCRSPAIILLGVAAIIISARIVTSTAATATKSSTAASTTANSTESFPVAGVVHVAEARPVLLSKTGAGAKAAPL